MSVVLLLTIFALYAAAYVVGWRRGFRAGAEPRRRAGE